LLCSFEGKYRQNLVSLESPADYNINIKTYNSPYVTQMLFVGDYTLACLGGAVGSVAVRAA